MINKLNALRNQAGEEGFTLIELLVVIIIIGILSAIAIPLFFNQQAEAIKASVKTDVRNTVGNVTKHLIKNPTADAAELEGLFGTDGVDNVKSRPENIINVRGAWNNYTVLGSNIKVSLNWYYMYDSATGQFTEGTDEFPTEE